MSFATSPQTRLSTLASQLLAPALSFTFATVLGCGATLSATDGGGSEGDGGAGTVDSGMLPLGTDAGSSSDGGSTGDIPLFVAQGHAGRTTLSCDDGRSWVAERSIDPNIRCFADGFDCDHHVGSAHGVVYGQGYFWATFGWGTPGSIERTRDGATWEVVADGTQFGGLAYAPDLGANGVLLAATRNAQRSLDHGLTFEDTGDTQMTGWSVRRTAFVPHGNGLFIMVADGEAVMSADGGISFSRMESLPTACMERIANRGGIAYGNNTILIVGEPGLTCRSTDGGQSWATSQSASRVRSHLVFSSGQFMLWDDNSLWTSTDGVQWESQATSPSGLSLGPVAVSDGGTLVAVNGGWNQSYDRQVFYRSTDGVTWQALASSDFEPGHPVRSITFGYGAPSAACSAP